MREIRLVICAFTLFISFSLKAGTNDVIVQLFEWSWEDVASECENFLGPHGYSGVQVSPPQEHVILSGRPWYERYQPVSYDLNSRSGDENVFREMVERCHLAGVDIYVDAVINHTASNPNPGSVNYGSGGSFFSYFNFPMYPDSSFFHNCRSGNDDSIRDWGNRQEIFNCTLYSLLDLDTGQLRVQNIIREYLIKLKNYGVKGLRVDAAKHINPQELHEILSGIFNPEYVYQEVIDLNNDEVIKAQEYFQSGKVLNFRYGIDLGGIFKTGDLRWLERLGEDWGYSASNKSMVFVDNHDTQRGHGPGGDNVLTYKDGALYIMANVFMLAWPYGQPVVMSSYQFKDGDQGPSSRNTQIEICQEPDWVCEHRNIKIAKLVKLIEEYRDTLISFWWSGETNQIAFSRENKYLFIFNRSLQIIKEIPSMNLEYGTYRELFSNEEFELSGQAKIPVNVLKNSYKVFIKK